MGVLVKAEARVRSARRVGNGVLLLEARVVLVSRMLLTPAAGSSWFAVKSVLLFERSDAAVEGRRGLCDGLRLDVSRLMSSCLLSRPGAQPGRVALVVCLAKSLEEFRLTGKWILGLRLGKVELMRSFNALLFWWITSWLVCPSTSTSTY